MNVSSRKNNKYLDNSKKFLSKIKKDNGNNYCFDCGKSNPECISLNYGIFICNSCAQFHIKLFHDKSKSSILNNNLNLLTFEQLSYLFHGGNARLSFYINKECPFLLNLPRYQIYSTHQLENYRQKLQNLVKKGISAKKQNNYVTDIFDNIESRISPNKINTFIGENFKTDKQIINNNNLYKIFKDINREISTNKKFKIHDDNNNFYIKNKKKIKSPQLTSNRMDIEKLTDLHRNKIGRNKNSLSAEILPKKKYKEKIGYCCINIRTKSDIYSKEKLLSYKKVNNYMLRSKTEKKFMIYENINVISTKKKFKNNSNKNIIKNNKNKIQNVKTKSTKSNGTSAVNSLKCMKISLPKKIVKTVKQLSSKKNSYDDEIKNNKDEHSIKSNSVPVPKDKNNSKNLIKKIIINNIINHKKNYEKNIKINVISFSVIDNYKNENIFKNKLKTNQIESNKKNTDYCKNNFPKKNTVFNSSNNKNRESDHSNYYYNNNTKFDNVNTRINYNKKAITPKILKKNIKIIKDQNTIRNNEYFILQKIIQKNNSDKNIKKRRTNKVVECREISYTIGECIKKAKNLKKTEKKEEICENINFSIIKQKKKFEISHSNDFGYNKKKRSEEKNNHKSQDSKDYNNIGRNSKRAVNGYLSLRKSSNPNIISIKIKGNKQTKIIRLTKEFKKLSNYTSENIFTNLLQKHQNIKNMNSENNDITNIIYSGNKSNKSNNLKINNTNDIKIYYNKHDEVLKKNNKKCEVIKIAKNKENRNSNVNLKSYGNLTQKTTNNPKKNIISLGKIKTSKNSISRSFYKQKNNKK